MSARHHHYLAFIPNNPPLQDNEENKPSSFAVPWDHQLMMNMKVDRLVIL